MRARDASRALVREIVRHVDGRCECDGPRECLRELKVVAREIQAGMSPSPAPETTETACHFCEGRGCKHCRPSPAPETTKGDDHE